MAMTYSFSTKKNVASVMSIPTGVDLSGYTLRAEFSRDTDWATIDHVKTVTGAGEFVSLNLTTTEVNTLLTTRYRIIGTIGGTERILQDGTIRHTLPPKTAGLTIDSPELVETFLPRIEYVAGEGADPAIIEGMMDTKIDAHRTSVLPHPTYDDMPSLRLLFENGLI